MSIRLGIYSTASLTFLVLAGCATSPLQRSQVVLYSEADMALRGNQSYEQMRAQMALSENQREIDYAQCVAYYIVTALDEEQRGDHEWELTVFLSEQANAFALPGGKMGVYNGLLDVATNQHQLAAVVAHEVGHVLARHSNERASQTTLRNVGRVIAQVAGVSDETIEMVDKGAELGLFLPFNRTQESEADKIGIMLMAGAGFRPEESVTLWQNMSAQGGAAPPELLSTHPSPATRINDLKSLMAPATVLSESANARGIVPDCQPPIRY